MLRSWLTILFISMLTVVCAAATIVSFIVSPRGSLFMWIARTPWSRGILWAAGVKLAVTGRENIKGGGPYIFMTNHQSLFDTPCLFLAIPLNLRMIAKRGLFYIPFFGWAMKAAGFISIDRENIRSAIKSLDLAAEKIRAGTTIIVFPEGTRTLDGNVRDFKKGPFALAVKAKVPIYPVSITGTMNILHKKSWRINPGLVRLHIGPEIDASAFEYDTKERLMEVVREAVVAGKKMLDEKG